MGEKDMYPKGKKQEYSRKLQVQSRHSQELRATSHSIRHSGQSERERAKWPESVAVFSGSAKNHSRTRHPGFPP